jgi:hypothetical protein
MPESRFDGAQADAFLAASIVLARGASTTLTWFEPSVRALEAAYNERLLLPVPTLAFDLMVLLNGERLSPIQPIAHEALREAMRGYEDHVLARLTADRRWTRLSEAVASLPKALRSAAVGLITARVLTRLKVNDGVAVSTGIVRRFAVRSPPEVLEAGHAALNDALMVDRLVDGLSILAKAARRARDLLSDAEVFLVENLAALQGLGARVGLAQLAEIAQAVDERLPARLRSSLFEDGDALTAHEEDSAFPVGGFASISTSGAVENLLPSELIYMESAASSTARPDLFDVRFVEHELLYFSRDESVAVLKKKVLVFIFDGSLHKSRVKDVSEAYQRLMWLLGSMTALLRRLAQWFTSDALTFELVFPEEGLSEEEALVALLLREFRERGQVVLRRAASSVAAVAQFREAHGARARIVLLSSSIPSGMEGSASPDGFLEVSDAQPRIHWARGKSESRSLPASGALSTWSETACQLLDGFMIRGALALPHR